MTLAMIILFVAALWCLFTGFAIRYTPPEDRRAFFIRAMPWPRLEIALYITGGLAFLGFVLLFLYFEPVSRLAATLKPGEPAYLDQEIKLRQNLTLIVGGLAGILGLIVALVRAMAALRQVKVQQRQIEVMEDGQVTERFGRAVEQLASESIHIRLGGIHALGRIARESDKDWRTVMELLMSFVRERSVEIRAELAQEQDVEPEEVEGPAAPADIQAAVKIIAHRKKPASEAQDVLVDLSGAWLPHADFEQINLQNVNLQSAELQGVNLYKARLNRTNFSSANLSAAILVSADIQDANLRYTNLQRSFLQGTWFQLSDLWGADFAGAKCNYANFRQATLFFAKNLTLEQLKTASTLCGAQLNEKIEAQLKLSHPELFEHPIHKALQRIKIRGNRTLRNGRIHYYDYPIEMRSYPVDYDGKPLSDSS